MASAPLAHVDDVLERLVAGVVVIGVLLWGASVLATPDETTPDPLVDPPRRGGDDHAEPLEDVSPPDRSDDEDDEDEGDDRDEDDQPTTSEPTRRKKGRGG